MKTVHKTAVVPALSFVALLAGCTTTTNAPKEVTGYVSDAMVTMALAATAVEACPDLSKNEDGVERYERSLDARLEADGFKGEEKQKVLRKVIFNSDVYFPPRIDAFGQKHNLRENDEAGFCKAVRKEIAAGSVYSKLLKG